MNKEQEFVMQLQGKSLREYAQKLLTGKFTIEKLSLNRYKVIEGSNNAQAYTLINRRTFILLDKELYKIQARENPLAAGIEKALDADALEFTVCKPAIDNLGFKLISRTLSSAKVRLDHVHVKLDNYIIRFSLVESVSERCLTEHEKEIAAMFTNANATNVKENTAK